MTLLATKDIPSPHSIVGGDFARSFFPSGESCLKTVEGPTDAVFIPRRDAISVGLAKLESDSKNAQCWFDKLDLLDLDLLSKPELEELIADAPRDFSRGMLYGKLTLRIQFAIVSQRSFPGTSSERVCEAIRKIEDRFQTLTTIYPEWFLDLETIDPDFCTRDELENLLLTAPTDFIEGMLFGKLTMRIQMAAFTGRVF